MKKLFVFVTVVLILAAVAVGIFLATFNADLYRPLVVGKLQEALGVPVKLEKISLGWRGGVVLSLKKLSVYPEPKGIYTDLNQRGKPSLQIGEISLLVRPIPLLKKKLEIASVALIQPRVRLSRGVGGAFQMEGIPFPPEKKPPSEQTTPPSSQTVPSGTPSLPSRPPASSPEAMALSIDRIEVEQGVIQISDSGLKPPAQWTMDRVFLQAGLKEDQVDLKSFSAQIGEGKVTGSGKAENLKSQAKIQFKITAQKLPIQSLLPVPEGGPHLTGELSGSFQGTAQGQTPEILSHSVSGDGKIQVSRPVLVNLNVLQEVFKQISIIPGLVETLQSRLPESYREKLTAQDTVFESIDLSMKVGQGALLFENLRLVSDTFSLTGTGRLGMDSSLSAQLQLKISPELSAAIVQSVKEFHSLAGSDGRIGFPVKIEGILPRVTVGPDLSYLTSHLVVNKVGDLLGNLLEKALEKSGK